MAFLATEHSIFFAGVCAWVFALLPTNILVIPPHRLNTRCVVCWRCADTSERPSLILSAHNAVAFTFGLEKDAAKTGRRFVCCISFQVIGALA